MNIVGISAYYHDAAACLVVDGKISAAAQEERFTRKKHDAAFPVHALHYCLAQAHIRPDEIDYVVFYEKPFVKFERLLETWLAFAPRGIHNFITGLPVWLKDKLFQRTLITDALTDLWGNDINWNDRLLFSEHHLSHAASAFFPGPFEAAAVLTMDGVGEWATTSLAAGNGADLQIHKEIHFPHSLGLLYSAVTYHAGFKVNSGEYKLMGLAPYGEPRFASVIKNHLIDIKPDGSYALDMNYFNYCTGLTMTNDKFAALFEGPPRQPESMLTQREMDMAASVQAVTDEVVIKLAKDIARSTGSKNLCLAGGVALNCVTNGKLLREQLFENIWIQPAAGDAGGAIGAALAAYHLVLKQPRKIAAGQDGMHGSYLGPEYTQQEVVETLNGCGAVFTILTDAEALAQTAQALAAGKLVGWMQGRMEFGPRALGARSILADPRSPSLQKTLNLRIKFRESFRPFAPSVLLEDVAQWFELSAASAYMQFVAKVATSRCTALCHHEESLVGLDKLSAVRSEIPAVTHVDYSARVQTVDAHTNPRYYQLLKHFKELTNCPVLVNTSFNVRGEPPVCSPEDAWRCFMATELDLLVIGNVLLYKSAQTTSSKTGYKGNYEPD